MREPRQLRGEENIRLKRLVADVSLDKQILSEVVKPSRRRVYRLDRLQLHLRVRRRKHLCLHRGVVPRAAGQQE